MAKPSIEAYLLNKIRKVEKSKAVLSYRTEILRDQAENLDWPANLVTGLKVVDDGTGHVVAMDPLLKEEIRNLNYPMPGKPAKPAITNFYYGLGNS
jgi:hypothetical protein